MAEYATICAIHASIFKSRDKYHSRDMNNTRYFDFLIDYRTFNRVMTNETCMFTQQWFVQGIAIVAPIDELSHKNNG